ncbi:50S ribosomal protein L32e [Candidatus Pacearchaeota archaeon]|nr:50S ribosomal protein L32e [Candidatus Pacearchaeota archaeon]
MVRKIKQFLRHVWHKHSKLGRGRKKKQKWKKPTGRDNKMREKIRGHPVSVSIGYRSDKAVRDKLKDKERVMIKNIQDLLKIKANQIGVVAKVGNKKRIEIVKKAKESKIQLYNINPDKFLEKINLKENVK